MFRFPGHFDFLEVHILERAVLLLNHSSDIAYKTPGLGSRIVSSNDLSALNRKYCTTRDGPVESTGVAPDVFLRLLSREDLRVYRRGALPCVFRGYFLVLR